MTRLFIGVNAVGLWDELFFICTVFTLLRRHFPTVAGQSPQAMVFVSFLWELGYQSWGPLLTFPFALVQGYIFNRTRSLPYVVSVHLIFDCVLLVVSCMPTTRLAADLHLLTPCADRAPTGPPDASNVGSIRLVMGGHRSRSGRWRSW